MKNRFFDIALIDLYARIVGKGLRLAIQALPAGADALVAIDTVAGQTAERAGQSLPLRHQVFTRARRFAGRRFIVLPRSTQ
ncbi:hypothetical protein D3C86_1703120 [compost metagenome]